LERWLAPRGGTVTDGARLAAINAVGLVVALLIVGVMSLLTRLLRHLLPLPFWFTGLVTLLILLALAVFIWFRFATAHGRAARASGRAVSPDLFGVIAAIPFVAVAVILTSSGLFGLFLSIITFSASRAGDAIQRLATALAFLLLAAGNVIIARAASD
jgi:hypothetical protein